MPIQSGELWVTDIPFASGSGSKKRPVVVLWLDGLDAVAVP
jgi:mRNA interferase MazF